MLSNIFWLLAILVMIVLLANGIYSLVTNIEHEKQFKEIIKRRIEILKNIESEEK